MTSHFDDDTCESYNHLIRGTPFAVHASQARRHLRTLSQSSHPPMATPHSQSNSLPEPDHLVQRPPLVQSYSTGYDYNPAYYCGPSTTSGNNQQQQQQQWPVPYQSPVEEVASSMSTIPAWASDTARFYQPPTPVVSDLFQLPVANHMSMAPSGTVQPSAIFSRSDLKDISCPQTSLGTPETSARATPVDDESYLRLQQATRAGLPNDQWQPAAPKTDPVMPMNVLHPQRSVGLTIEEDGRDMSEPNESPLALPVLFPAVIKPANGEKKKRTRTPQACEACRKRKAKCTGGQPCGRCNFKHLSCVFADIRPKIPPPTKGHHATAGSRDLTSPQQAKKRRHSDNARYENEPIVQSSSTSPAETGPAYPVVEDKNLLQLRFDEPPYQPQTWVTYSHPSYGYTGNIDTSGFSALGFQQSYVPPISGPSYVQPQYTYNSAPLNPSMDSLGTPSISTNSSPSYGEASLLSPYDFNMYGQGPVDNYFPTSEA